MLQPRFNKIYLIQLIYIIGLLSTTISCAPKGAESVSELITPSSCAELECAAIIDAIKIAEHNLNTIDKDYTKTDIEKCFMLASPCGVHLIYSIQQLIEGDSSRFNVLKVKYPLNNSEDFALYLAEEPSGFKQKIESLTHDIENLCSCSR